MRNKLGLKKTYFTQIFLVILSVLLLCSLVLSWTIFRMSNTSIRNGEKAVVRTNVERFSSWNDVRINTAEAILDSLQSNENVITYALLGERIQTMNISRTLNPYNSVFTQFSMNVGIIDPQRQASITATEINRINLNKITLPDTLDTTHYARSVDTELTYLNNHTFSGSTFYKRRVYAGDHELLFFYILYDNLDKNFIDTTDEKGNYCIFQNNELIYQTNPDARPAETLSMDYGLSEDDGLLCFRQISQSNPGFSYLYYTKAPSIWKPMVYFLAWLLLLCTLSVALAYVLARNLSNPVRSLIKSLHSVNNDSDQNYDMSYLINSMDHIFADLIQLRKENSENKGLLVQKFLNDLCTGSLSATQAESLVRDYNLALLKAEHTPVSFVVANHSDLVEQYGPDGIVYLKKDILEILTDSIPDFYQMDDSYASFTIFMKGTASNQVTEKISSVLDWLQTEFDVQLKVYVGNTVSDYTQEETAYKNILLLRNDPFLPESKTEIYNVADQRPAVQDSVYYTLEMERQLIDYILHGRKETALQTIESAISSNFHETATYVTATQLQTCFNITINRILRYLNKNIADVYPDLEVLNFAIQGTDAETLQKKLVSMFTPVLETIPSVSETEVNNDYVKISKYIDENIKNNIGLDDLASYLNYSSWYTSKIFKNTFNQNFKTYVNIRRVEIAKGLLDEGLKVSEVAAEVGCIHPETFIRIFKKVTGLSPSEYAHRK